jgi:hypothetical protein
MLIMFARISTLLPHGRIIGLKEEHCENSVINMF